MSTSDEWGSDAEAIKHQNMLLHPKDNAGPGAIAMGLRAGFHIKKARKPDSFDTISPAFFVQNVGHGRAEKAFKTDAYGLYASYIEAVDHYAELHKLDANERAYLVSKCPSHRIFTEDLWLELVLAGHDITKREVVEKLKLPSYVRVD